MQTATLDEPEHGLSEAVLDQTDVLIWWGHAATTGSKMRSPSASTSASCDEGMGFIALHWGAGSKVFKKLMGTSCSLTPIVSGAPEQALGD